ncbi:MAG: S8 family serine peptidase [Saprospiraceae bacterium]|nr:S8 family serine peptidase [Saprospiraceae bacterium]
MMFKNPLTFLFLFSIPLFYPGSWASGQKLDYRLGEFLLKLDPAISVQDFEKHTLNGRSRSSAIHIDDVIHKDWNIVRLKFDHTTINEYRLFSEIRNWPGVLMVQRNHLIEYRRKPNDSYYDRQWWHFNDGTYGVPGADFKTELAWDLSTGGLTENGDTIVLCIIDDGLDIQHYDIRPNHWKNHAEIPNNGVDDDSNGYIDDYNGWNTFQKNDQFALGRHGTPVCGLAAARGNNNLGVCGMSWNVKLMFVSGGGDEAMALQAYAYPWQARKMYNLSGGKQGAFVVATNSSWGADYRKPEEAPLWCAVYDSLGAVGILNAASTTNLDLNVDMAGDLPTTCESDWLITVTNMESNDQKDITSGYGPKSIDIGAFGENVFTIAPSNGLDFFKGTSAAAPQISGAIALLYSMPCNAVAELAKTDPAGAALMMKQLILNNVRPIPSLQGITVSGGVLDFERITGALIPVSSIYENGEIHFKGALSPMQYPVFIEFRKSGENQWLDGVLNSDLEELTFEAKEDCTDYEFRVKGGCSLLGNEFSKIQILKTGGCCLAPDRISLASMATDHLILNISKPDRPTKLAYLIKSSNAQSWDTSFLPAFQESQIRISGLLPCRSYQVLLYYFCDDELSDFSDTLEFTTQGCEWCTDASYCQRGRPQSSFEWIEAVAINQQWFASGNDLGYGIHFGKTADWKIQKNISQEISIQPGFALDTNPTHFACWLDWNANGIFETQETLIPDGTIGTGLQSFTFTMPQTAIVGMSRMRVMVKYAVNNNEPPQVCGQGLEFGEYEDYCVYLDDGLCADIEDVYLAGKTNTTAWFGMIKSSVDDLVYYQYRKQNAAEWISGTTRASDLVLMDLDSCTRYQIRIGRICGSRYNDPIDLNFTTEGFPCQPTSVKPGKSENINLFPNPFDEYFTISFEGKTQMPDLQIFDLSGQSLNFRTVRIGPYHCRIFPEPGLSGMLWIRLLPKDGNPQSYRMIRMK